MCVCVEVQRSRDQEVVIRTTKRMRTKEDLQLARHEY